MAFHGKYLFVDLFLYIFPFVRKFSNGQVGRSVIYLILSAKDKLQDLAYNLMRKQ